MNPIFYSDLTKETLVELVVRRNLLPIGKANLARKALLIDILATDDQQHQYKTISEANAAYTFTADNFSKKPSKKLLTIEQAANKVRIQASLATKQETLTESKENSLPSAEKSTDIEQQTADKPVKNKAVKLPKALKSSSKAHKASTENQPEPIPGATEQLAVAKPSTSSAVNSKKTADKIIKKRGKRTKNNESAPSEAENTESVQEEQSLAVTKAPTDNISLIVAERQQIELNSAPSTDSSNKKSKNPSKTKNNAAKPTKPEAKARPAKSYKLQATTTEEAATLLKDDYEAAAVSEVDTVNNEALLHSEFAAPNELADFSANAEHDETETESENAENGNEDFSNLKEAERKEAVSGVLDIVADGYGFLRSENYNLSSNDYFVSPQLIRRFNLRNGDYVTGYLRKKRDNERYQAISFIKEVNGLSPEKLYKRPHFGRLVPIYTEERYTLETTSLELSTRIIDLICPIGKGQRGMIVSPPKAGKTILLQKIADAISRNNPEAHLIVLLIDERPEEVTDMQRRINGEVVYSTFDQTSENHVKITELVLERAKRLVELGQDVVILLDSITRLARAYNLTINPTGRTLSGGLDPGALHGPKRFFGAARKIENGGSLTIVATALVDTGSRMDEVIFEEFKGTGNMEVFLDRKLSEKRIFPAIDINRSGTRREELLLSERELDCVWSIRKAMGKIDPASVTELILNFMQRTKNNAHFVEGISLSLNDKDIIESLLKKNGNKNNSY